MGGTKNIEPVDFQVISRRHRPHHPRIGGDAVIKNFPLCRGKFLGIVQAGTAETLRKNHRGGSHWSCQWTPTGLVDASNADQAASPEHEFKPEVRHD